MIVSCALLGRGPETKVESRDAKVERVVPQRIGRISAFGDTSGLDFREADPPRKPLRSRNSIEILRAFRL